MEWARAHPYSSAFVAVAILIAAGIFVIESRSPAALSSSSTTWSGGVPPSSYESGSAPQSPQEIAQDVIRNQGSATLSLPPLASSSASFAPTTDSVSYEQLLAQLSASTSQNASSRNSQGAPPSSAPAYELIPEDLATGTAQSAASMTPDQEALYTYGNAVGGEIQSFESLHADEAEVLKDQAEDRTDPTKAAALVSLGKALGSVGMFMQQMQEIPPSAATLHASLAQSYIDIGAKLQLVAQAQTDAEFVQAVESYDSSANTFVRNYAALAQYFSGQGVTFSPSDPGSVFSFTGNGGL